MIAIDEREHTEKIRSAVEASQTTPELFMPAEKIARYRAPSQTTVFPLEYAFHLLGDVKGKTVLEYGCGDGLNTVILADRGAKVIALDISAPLLALARKRLEINGYDGVELLLGSGHSLPLADESVDIVFGMAILHHLDLESASREIRRVLKKGGRGIFEEPLRNSRWLSRIRQFFPQQADVSPFERPLTDPEINEFVKPCEYRAKTFQLLLSSVASLLPIGTRKAIRFCTRVDGYLLRLFPFLDYYGTIKVFEMTKKESQDSSAPRHFCKAA